MADKPTRYPEWATNDETDSVNGLPNKIEPSTEFKLSGLQREEPLPRQYVNDQFNLISDWMKWIDEQLTGSLSPTLEAAWPVGSVYFSTSATNPASTFGFGTWEAVSQGKFIATYNSGDSDFNTVEGTGGSKTHTHGGNTGATVLTESQIPVHSHKYFRPLKVITETGANGSTYTWNANNLADANDDANDGWLMEKSVIAAGSTATGNDNTGAAGGGAGHLHSISSASNLSPYVVLVAWKRTA